MLTPADGRRSPPPRHLLHHHAAEGAWISVFSSCALLYARSALPGERGLRDLHAARRRVALVLGQDPLLREVLREPELPPYSARSASARWTAARRAHRAS